MTLLFRALLLLGLAVLACAEPQARCPAPAPPAPIEEPSGAGEAGADHGFLWRISRDGHSSYLYGTIHIARREWTRPGPQLAQALRASDTIALELDALDPQVAQDMAQAGAGARTTALPEALRQRLHEQADAACVAYESISALPPELQIAALSALAARADGLDPSYGIDAVLAAIAHHLQRDVVSLETVALQMRMLQMESAQETATFVQEGLDELQSGRTRTLAGRVAQVWAQSDTEQMEHFAQWCQCMDTAIERAMMKRTLDDRNPLLADRIDALHRSGRQVLAAVGSLHLFGPNGLPALLAQRGYRVQAIDLHPRP